MDREQLLRLNAILLGVLVAIALVATLMVARPVILPFVMALLLAYAVEPAVRIMVRFRIPRWAGALVILATFIMVLQAVVGIVGSAIGQLKEQLPIYLSSLQRIIDALPLPEGAERIRVDQAEFWRELLPVEDFYGQVGSVAGELTGVLGNGVLVLMLMMAAIIGRRNVDARLDALAGGASSGNAAVIDAIDAGIQRYLLLKTGLSLGVGVCFGVVLAICGIDTAVFWGFIAFLLNYIPTVGPILATIPPILLLFLQYPDDLEVAVIGSAVAATVPFVFGNIIEPKVFGGSLNLNFFAVLFALVLWTFIWGVAGAVLSVPLTMAISLICKEVPALRPIHELLRA